MLAKTALLFVTFAPSYAGPTTGTKKVIQGEGSAITWTLSCRSTMHICGKVENALVEMAGFLENAVALKPIAIHFTHAPFYLTKASKNTALGSTTLPKMIEVQDEDLVFAYPQALYKQKFPTDSVELAKFDMFIEMDAAREWYFPSDYPKMITNGQFSFMDVLAHEINHGLGFKSGLKDLHTSILPDNEEQHEGHVLNLHKSFSIYDKFIHVSSTEKSLTSYAHELKMLADLDKYEAMEEIYHTIMESLPKVGGNYFRTKDYKMVLNNTLPTGKGGLTHLSTAYQDTRSSFMVSFLYRGVSVTSQFVRDMDWPTAPYSKEILQMLETLGYTLNPSPNYQKSMLHRYPAKVEQGTPTIPERLVRLMLPLIWEAAKPFVSKLSN